jgi:hypothetical protein
MTRAVGTVERRRSARELLLVKTLAQTLFKRVCVYHTRYFRSIHVSIGEECELIIRLADFVRCITRPHAPLAHHSAIPFTQYFQKNE